MPRRLILTDSERENLLVPPDNKEDLIRHYSFSESDLSIIRQHRGAANRIGFAVQLCYMRYPGIILGTDEIPHPVLLKFVAGQLNVPTDRWKEYGKRFQTRREHLVELQTVFKFKTFGTEYYQAAVEILTDIAWQTDKGIVLAEALMRHLRGQSILLPSINVVERICAEAITKSTRRIYTALTENLSKVQLQGLDSLLALKPESKVTMLSWLRQPTGTARARHILEHIERLQATRELGLPDGLEKSIHQNRLLKIAREGRQMTPADLGKFEQNRRYATLAALVLELQATITDEIIELNDRIIGRLFSQAKRSHEQQFQQSGKEINDKVRLLCRIGQALIQAKQTGSDPFAAIEDIIPWDTFAKSITEAQSLSQSEDFDYLHLIGDHYSQIRRYAPVFLETLQLSAAPAAREIIEAVETLKRLNAANLRKIPDDAPTGFVRKRWKPLVFTDEGVSRRYYELCLLSELKNSLRSGDVWVQGSRQFKDFNEYLLPANRFSELKETGNLGLSVDSDCERYLNDRMQLLTQKLETVNQLAANDELQEVTIGDSGLRISPLTNAVPDEANNLMRQAYELLPHVKITELLQEVDEWTGISLT